MAIKLFENNFLKPIFKQNNSQFTSNFVNKAATFVEFNAILNYVLNRNH